MNTAAGLPELRLKARADRRIRAGHLWIYSNEIDVASTPLKQFEPGDIVRVVTEAGRCLGYAGINPHTLIAGRLISRDPARPPGKQFLAHRMKAALKLRRALYPPGYFRLLFGESDGVPGLIADCFGDYVVLQTGTAAMEKLKGEIVDAVTDVLQPAGILWRNDSGARDMETLDRYVEVASGSVPDLVPVLENGLEFLAPLHDGQKTGWFYDQRDNRRRFTRYPAKRMLDVFCYTGAWGLGAAMRGASATFVDASAQALHRVESEGRRLGLPTETLQGNAFEVLRSLRDHHRQFDIVVVDPPAFIKRRKDYRQGLAAYQRVNQLAMLLLDREGWLVSCSCSYHLSTADLLAALQRAARHVSRTLRVVEIGGQSADHPIHPSIPETRYLKALFCRVTSENL
jgi:23S rRNA (cytosine1962-C5)-methyltransferase